jgi:excisionase family DNA binding protein
MIAQSDIALPASQLDALAELLAPRLADRVVAALHGETDRAQQKSRHLLSATEVAEQLNVSRGWVYEHAEELGAVRIGGGRKPRLRFPADALPTSTERVPIPEPQPTPPAKHQRGLIEVDDDW